MTESEAVGARIKRRFELVSPLLDERQRRLFAAAEAVAYGVGGLVRVSRLLGVSRRTVARGIRELADFGTGPVGRVRRRGGGRKPLTETEPTLLPDLEWLVESDIHWEPDAPLLWTTKSCRQLSAALDNRGHYTSERTVRVILHDLGFTLSASGAVGNDRREAEREAQFRHINETVLDYHHRGQPVISLATKRCEQVEHVGDESLSTGQRRATSRTLEPEVTGEVAESPPESELEAGWDGPWDDGDTAACVLPSLRQWWHTAGRATYPPTDRMLIVAEGRWRPLPAADVTIELQRLADESGLVIDTCHFPPGTHRWNSVEVRLFSHAIQAWRGATSVLRQETVISLIVERSRNSDDRSDHRPGVPAWPEAAGLHVSGRHGKLRPAVSGGWNHTIRPRGREST